MKHGFFGGHGPAIRDDSSVNRQVENMTERLYDADGYCSRFDARTVSCTAAAFAGRSCYDLVLDRSAFFPEQGGQDSDTGAIVCGDKSSKVFHVSIKNGEIHHFCDTELAEGSEVRGELDWAERYDKMRQHSGEHLVSGCVHRHFGYDNVGFHLGKDEVTLDFNGTFSPEELDAVEDEVNFAIAANIESVITFPSKQELEKIPYRSKKELSGEVRIVEFPGYDICACCAPHVRRTGEIGMIKIVSAEHFRGGTRIMINCGERALKDYRRLLEECRSISRLLSVRIPEVSAATARLSDSLARAKYDMSALQKQLLRLLADRALTAANPVIFIESADPDNAREAVNSLTGRCGGICACFTGCDEKGYNFVIASSERDCRTVLEAMKEHFDMRGGGSAAMVRGTCIGKRSRISEFFDGLK